MNKIVLFYDLDILISRENSAKKCLAQFLLKHSVLINDLFIIIIIEVSLALIKILINEIRTLPLSAHKPLFSDSPNKWNNKSWIDFNSYNNFIRLITRKDL